MKELITFGCSWTYGVGASWDSSCNYNEQEYRQYCMNQDINTRYSFRHLISEKYNLKNINFSEGMGSNQRSFRLAREYFASNEVKNAIVLWGITSTARNEYYDPISKSYNKIKFNDGRDYNKLLDHPFEQEFFLKTYDHTNEVKILAEKMLLWNNLFKFYNIPVIWFDTFNTHEYSYNIDNLIKGDLLTQMLEHKHIELSPSKFYHYSSWINDDPRISAGKKHKLLNPISYHPTQEGHKTIAEILEPHIEEKL